MKLFKILSLVAVAAAVSACGGDDDPPPPPPGFTQPAGTVAVNFSVDDTANKLFKAGELQWKGSMAYDATTRKITKDSTWAGPFAPLYDDGPWNAFNTTTNAPGHEPAGSTAGDNKWGVTVFVTPPATGSEAFEYGLIDTVYETNFGNGWIWQGSNGTFTVAAGATTAVNASGLTLQPFGTKDVQLVLDKNALGSGTWDTSTVKVKGSGWAWGEVTLSDNGQKGDATANDGKYTFVLSEYVGSGKQFAHSGLMKSGDKPEFIFVLNGVEYKDTSGNAQTAGVSAGTRTGNTGAFTAATIALATNKNTYITVP